MFIIPLYGTYVHMYLHTKIELNREKQSSFFFAKTQSKQINFITYICMWISIYIYTRKYVCTNSLC